MVHADPIAELLGEARAHVPVMVAMRAHAGMAAVQMAACRMMSIMAVNNGGWLLELFVLHTHRTSFMLTIIT